MAFLNKKEDVIDFQLTQYGKYLVSQGKFKPVYYAFFDDDIIYDLRYVTGSALETQKDIETRIFDNTPSLDTQYLFHSVDNLKPQDQFIRSESEFTDRFSWSKAHFGEKLQQVPEKHYVLSNPISNSDLKSSFAPALDIRLVEGEISSSVTTISGTTDQPFPTRNIPQLNLKDVKFYVSIQEYENYDSDLVEGESSDVFEDGTYLSVKENNLLLEIKEENVPLTKENFDIEVFVLDLSGNIDYPLYFDKEEQVVQNGVLLDEPVVKQIADADIDMVRYFFDLVIDDEVF